MISKQGTPSPNNKFTFHLKPSLFYIRYSMCGGMSLHALKSCKNTNRYAFYSWYKCNLTTPTNLFIYSGTGLTILIADFYNTFLVLPIRSQCLKRPVSPETGCTALCTALQFVHAYINHWRTLEHNVYTYIPSFFLSELNMHWRQYILFKYLV